MEQGRQIVNILLPAASSDLCQPRLEAQIGGKCGNFRKKKEEEDMLQGVAEKAGISAAKGACQTY